MAGSDRDGRSGDRRRASAGQGSRRQGRTGGRQAGERRQGRAGGRQAGTGRRQAGERRQAGTGGRQARGSRRAQREPGERGFGPYRRRERPARTRRSPQPEPAAQSEQDRRRRARFRVVGDGDTHRRALSRPRDRGRAIEDRRAAPRSRRRRSGAADVHGEIVRLGGRKGERQYEQLLRAADAFAREHERETVRILRPLRDDLPESPSIRELLGLALYRTGRFPAAAKELEEFVRLTGSVEQHPVLMDCHRAQRRWRKVDRLWHELVAASPAAELMTEGRIVAAGALADQGRIDAAVDLLARRERPVTRARPHHLRLWYALGDLEERAGNLPRARALFGRVREHDPAFADVAERLAALG
jgi:tetratricopeptide (TPR) repeat protein